MIVENFKEYFDKLLNDSSEQNTRYQKAELELPNPSNDKIELIKKLKINKLISTRKFSKLQEKTFENHSSPYFEYLYGRV